MNKVEQNLIDAVNAAIAETAPPAFDDWNGVVKLAEKHDLHNLMAELAPKIDSLPKEDKDALYNTQMASIIKDANQEAEVDKLIYDFDNKNIKAILLKGWYIKQLYPRRDLRTMADTDIFISQSDELSVHNIMKKHGYQCYAIGNKKDNAYTKEPFFTIEIHKNLFYYEDDWNLLFNSPDSDMYIWDRLVLIDDYKKIYRMDDELFFVYMIAHTAKHLMDDGGIGARAFLDIWVYLKNKPDLDFNIVFRDFDKLNLTKFAKTAIALSKFWFDGKNASPEVEQFGAYILKCGVYGNSDNFVINNEVMRDGKTHSKWGYAFKRAFPNMESMKVRYPQLEKKPWLLPVCYTKRLWYSLTRRKDAIKGEIGSAGNVDYEQARRIRELYKSIGLEGVTG